MARMTTEQRKRYDLYSGILSRIYQDVNAVGVKGNRIAMQRVFNAGQRRIRAAGFAGDLRSAMTRRYGKGIDYLWAGAYGSQEPPWGKGKTAAGGGTSLASIKAKGAAIAASQQSNSKALNALWERQAKERLAAQQTRQAIATAEKFLVTFEMWPTLQTPTSIQAARNQVARWQASGIPRVAGHVPRLKKAIAASETGRAERTADPIAETMSKGAARARTNLLNNPGYFTSEQVADLEKTYGPWGGLGEIPESIRALLGTALPAGRVAAYAEEQAGKAKVRERMREAGEWPGTGDVQRAWAQFETRDYDPEFLEPLPEKLLEQMLATHPDMIARAFDHQIKENTDAWYRLWRANPKVMLNAPLLAQQWTAARYGAVANWLRGQGRSVGAPPSYDDYLTSVSSVMARKAIMPSIKMPLARTSARAIVVPEFGKQVLEPPSPLPPPPSDRLIQQMARMPAAGVFASTANLLSYVGEQTRGQGIRPSPAQALTAAMNLADLASKAGHLQPVNYLGVVSDLALLGTATGVISPEAGQRYQSYIGMASAAYGVKQALTPWLSKVMSASVAGPIGWAVAAATLIAGLTSAHQARKKAIAEQEAYQRKLQTARIVGMVPSALRPLSGFQYVQPRRALPLVRGGPSTLGEAARIPYTTARP